MTDILNDSINDMPHVELTAFFTFTLFNSQKNFFIATFMKIPS